MKTKLNDESRESAVSAPRSPAGEDRACEVCGRIFSSLSPARKVCSADCVVKRVLSIRQNAPLSKGPTPRMSATKSLPPTRKCHDCGAPTFDYRCKSCRIKWRLKNGVASSQGACDEASEDDIWDL